MSTPSIGRAVLCATVVILIASAVGWCQEDPQAILASLPPREALAGRDVGWVLLECSLRPSGPVREDGFLPWTLRLHVRLLLLTADAVNVVQTRGLLAVLPGTGVAYARAILPTGDVVPADGVARVGGETEDFLSGWSLWWILFPSSAIREGAVLECEACSEDLGSPSFTGGELPLSFTSSVYTSRLTVETPPGRELHWKLVGDASLSVRKDGSVYTFTALRVPHNWPGLWDCPCSMADGPAIAYSTAESWGDVVSGVRQMLADPSASDPLVVDEARRSAQGAEDRAEKIARLYAYVRDSVTYGFVADRYSLLAAPSIETLADKIADCKGKALLLVAMLRAVGIEAYPALVSTTCRMTDMGEALWPYGLWRIDHVVVAVADGTGSAWQILDPTCQDCELGGHTAWILDGGSDSPGTFYTIPRASAEERTISCKLSARLPSGGTPNVAGTVTVASDLVALCESRARSIGENGTTFEMHWGEALGLNPPWNKATMTVTAGEEGEPAVVKFRALADLSCSSTCAVQLAGAPSPRRLPIGIPGQGQTPGCALPFEIEPMTWTCSATLDVPHGWVVQAPADMHISAPGAAYDATYVWDGSRLSVSRRLVVTADAVAAEDYAAFAAVIDQAEADNTQALVCTW